MMKSPIGGACHGISDVIFNFIPYIEAEIPQDGGGGGGYPPPLTPISNKHLLYRKKGVRSKGLNKVILAILQIKK